MTAARTGFLLERLSLTGPGKSPAEITFADGLNVITGASDTGKSYALGCIDYALGARRLTRTIPQADGYETVVLWIRARESGNMFEITRALAGGDVSVREFDATGSLRGERTLGARHDAKDVDTLSGLLLDLSGLAGKHVRKNKQGEIRSLSFRDVAFLILVEEERIISERPPHISGSPVEQTVESAALRLLATGSESGVVISVPQKQGVESARAQLELVQQLDARLTAEIERVGLGEADVEAEIARIESARHEALSAYEGARVELVEMENRIATAVRELRDVDARTVVAEGMERRFELLRQHYESDLSRLDAVEKAGTLLESFPAKVCPVCGAAPKDHRGTEAEAHFSIAEVREAAKKEATKVAALQSDLSRVLGNLSQELAGLSAIKEHLKSEVSTLQDKINHELYPTVSASVASLQSQAERQDLLFRARTLVEQRDDLRKRQMDLVQTGKASSPKISVDTTPTTAELEGFTVSVQELLQEWNFPDAGRVVFSESEQDLVIGGQRRGSHGKGVRALSCAAFITGLMRHCVDRGLPHPGLVLLDSPLLVYKEPDMQQENQRLRLAGVKEAFYRSLAEGTAGGQVIVFENENPPTDIVITRHHFSKASTGRYGFIPT